MTRRRLVVAVDLDAIIIDLIRPWLNWYNEKYDDNLTVDEVTNYKLETHAKKANKHVYRFFENLDNYAKCPVLLGASEGLQALNTSGHDVIIASATAGRTASLKWDMVEKAAPWIHVNDVMVGARKELIRADVFIDDSPKNIVKYRNAWPQAHILTIAYPYNKDCRSVVNLYAQDHNHTDKAWESMVQYIDALAGEQK